MIGERLGDEGVLAVAVERLVADENVSERDEHPAAEGACCAALAEEEDVREQEADAGERARGRGDGAEELEAKPAVRREQHEISRAERREQRLEDGRPVDLLRGVDLRAWEIMGDHERSWEIVGDEGEGSSARNGPSARRSGRARAGDHGEITGDRGR